MLNIIDPGTTPFYYNGIIIILKSQEPRKSTKSIKYIKVELYIIGKTLLTVHKKCNFLICRFSEQATVRHVYHPKQQIVVDPVFLHRACVCPNVCICQVHLLASPWLCPHIPSCLHPWRFFSTRGTSHMLPLCFSIQIANCIFLAQFFSKNLHITQFLHFASYAATVARVVVSLSILLHLSKISLHVCTWLFVPALDCKYNSVTCQIKRFSSVVFQNRQQYKSPQVSE